MPIQDESSRQAHPLESERVNAATLDIDRMSPLEIAQVMNAEDARVAGAVAETLPQVGLAIERIAERMRQGGRMIYVGAGTSGRLGALDAAECPPTFNVSPDLIVSRIAGGTFAWTTATEDAEDRADLGESDMAALDLGALDSVVGVTASGHTPYALAALSACAGLWRAHDWRHVQCGYAATAPERHRHHADCRSGSHQRLDPLEGRRPRRRWS